MTMLRRAKILVKFNVIHHEEKFPRQFKYRWMVTSKIFFWNKRGLLRKKFASVLGNKMLDLKGFLSGEILFWKFLLNMQR